MPLSVLFCVSAGSAVTVLHERVWESSACKTPDHWPVHTLNAVSLSVCRFHLYFVSFPVLSCLIVSPFIPSICLSVRLSLLLAFCGRCGLSLKPRPWMCQWLHPPAQQSSASTRCPLSPRPAPAVTCDPGGSWGPLLTMLGYFVLGGGCSVLETPGSSCTWKPGNIRNFKLT